jgi:hypothetical protein
MKKLTKIFSGFLPALLFVIGCSTALSSKGQVMNYNFSQSNGTYTPLTSPTVLSSGAGMNDATFSYMLPFYFIFNGVVENQIYISENGYVSFGANDPGPIIVPIMSPVSGFGAASPFSTDLLGIDTASQLSYQLTGTAPNRVLTVQWTHMKSWSGSGQNFNFQLKLYETSSVIEFVYGTVSTTTIRLISVGLRGNSNLTFMSRTELMDWSNTLAGTQNNQACKLYTNVFPASGLTFIFTPTQTMYVNPTTWSGSGTLTVPIKVAHFHNVETIQGSLHWDPNVLSYTGYTSPNTTINFPAWGINTSQTASGIFRFLWYDPTLTGVSVADTTTILSFNFNVVNPSAGSTVVSFSNSPTSLEIDTVDANANPDMFPNPNFVAGTITLSSNTCASTSHTITQTACDSFLFNGINQTVSGTYLDTLVNAAGCDSFLTLNLTVYQPTHSASTITACDSYTWNGTTYTTSGTYTYSYNNGNGCASVDTLHLTIKLPTTSTTNTSVCISALPYSWNGNNYNATGAYTLHFTNAAGCDSAATLNLTVNSLPTINAGADKLICPGTSTTLTATGGVSYSWTGGVSNGVAFTPSATVTYVVTGTDANGCSNNDTVVVNIRDLSVLSSGPRICKGLTVTLTAPSGTNYVWKKNGGAMNGKTSRAYVASAAGNYSVTYTDSMCGKKTLAAAPLIIQNRPNPTTLTATLTSFCLGFSTTLSAANNYPLYTWYLGAAPVMGVVTKSYTTAVAGAYKLKVIDSFGCVSNFSNSVVINKLQNPTTGITISNATQGAKKLTSMNATTYQWRLNGNNITGATAKIYTATISGNYSVTVTNSGGCSATTADTLLIINYTGPKLNQDELLALTEQEENEAIVVYPNPSTGIFTIATENSIKATITDLQGRILMELNDTTTINLSQYANGIYLLQLLDEENRVIKTVKLVKE